jgi:serine phosphatase RsbU (regulator of sigma subunit)
MQSKKRSHPDQPAAPGAAPDKKRILLVDDNTAIHEDFKHILNTGAGKGDEEKAALEQELFAEESGEGQALLPVYQIDDAYQGEEAIAMADAAAAEGFPYAVIFMDVRMPPGMDGVQTTREIWKRHPYVEIVICTAHSDYSWEEILKAFGSTDHLLFVHKPFDSVTIKQTALTLCTKWELDRQNRNYITHLEERIAERTRDLEALVREKESIIGQIHEEMALAEIVQHHLLPTDLPALTALRIAAHYIPTEEIGGDLYDVIPLADDNVAFLIFDVSGHGIAAALVATIAKFSFRQHLPTAVTPDEALALVNLDIFATTPANMYISGFLMIYNMATRQATFAGAGHPAPLLVKAATGTVEKLIVPGLFLGVNDTTRYANRTLQLDKGDKIVLYTDGLIETYDGQENLYGKDRLIEQMLAHRHQPCEELLQHILLDNERFRASAPRTDDLCLLGIEIQ